MSLGVPLGQLELAAFLPYRLAVLSAEVSRALGRRYDARFGVTIPEWRCLAVLGRKGDLMVSELASRASLDKVKACRALARLRQRGLVARAVDGHDRRAVRMSLTPAGWALYGELAAVALDWERQLTDALGLSDRRALDRVLHKLSDALGRMER
ncbi:MAG: MarR family transcriptional regulator [Geminicoccaceae bacterium]|nr:MAG: MarR family transcriptional regulator [Geminicoccaceae bacterium]